MKTLKQILDLNFQARTEHDREVFLEVVLGSVEEWLQQKYDRATPHTKERQIINELLRELDQ